MKAIFLSDKFSLHMPLQCKVLLKKKKLSILSKHIYNQPQKRQVWFWVCFGLFSGEGGVKFWFVLEKIPQHYFKFSSSLFKTRSKIHLCTELLIFTRSKWARCSICALWSKTQSIMCKHLLHKKPHHLGYLLLLKILIKDKPQDNSL